MSRMTYSREIYARAAAELEQRHSRAHARAAEFRERVEREIPRVLEIEQKMSASSGKVIQAVIAGNDVAAAVEKIKAENLSLQVELSLLLEEHGETVTNFEPQYTCPQCQDTGMVNGKRCICMEALLRELSCESLSDLSPMKPASFDEMRLDYYSDRPEGNGISPRARMAKVIEYCRCYAADFDGQDNSLLLCGPTGTGKTHLSLAIAGQVMARGYSVVYGPVQKLLHRLEREHFGRQDGDSEDILLNCDLLILDDLGTEFTGSFYVSALYNIINGRMLDGKPTIISTNLNAAELADRYGEATASRITGTYQPLACSGADIRLLKLRQSLN